MDIEIKIDFANWIYINKLWVDGRGGKKIGEHGREIKKAIHV